MVDINAQYGTTVDDLIKCAIIGAVVHGSSGVGDSNKQTTFTDKISVGHVIKVRDKFALNFAQTINSQTKITCDAANISNSDTESSGTVSITNATSTVTGVSTFFTRLSVGDLLVIDSEDPVEIASIASNTSCTITTTWSPSTKSAVTFVGYKVESFEINRSVTPGLGLHLAHDESIDWNHLENDNWLKIERYLLQRGEFMPIQANESIAIDDCLYVLDKSDDWYIVGKCDIAFAQNKLPCAGFSTKALSQGQRAEMKIGHFLTNVGTTDYPYGTLYVGDNSKIAWDGSSNAPSSGEYRSVIGEGRGIGELQFSFTPISDIVS